jgi:hypothetical protein
MARRLLLKPAVRDVGERLLTSKLQILNGSGNRRPSLALSILTGRVAEQLSILENFYPRDPAVAEKGEEAEQIEETEASAEPVIQPVNVEVEPTRPHLVARTVYLSEAHMRDIEAIIDAWQANAPKRLTRSAVLRRAIEHLRNTVEAEAEPANSLLESQPSCPKS